MLILFLTRTGNLKLAIAMLKAITLRILRIPRVRYRRACCLHSCIPPAPTWELVDASNIPENTDIDLEMIKLLERLTLVDFGNEEGVQRLKAAVAFAKQLDVVDTEGVEPMYSVLEDSQVYLREDRVTEGFCQADILSNASLTEEAYFVAPPGNIPLSKHDEPYVRPELDEKT